MTNALGHFHNASNHLKGITGQTRNYALALYYFGEALRGSKPLSAVEPFTSSRKIFQRMGAHDWAGKASFFLGITWQSLGNFEQASEAFDTAAKELALANEDKLRGYALVNFARSLFSHGKMERVKEILLEAKRIAVQGKYQELEADVDEGLEVLGN